MRIVSTDQMPWDQIVRLAVRPPLEEVEPEPATMQRTEALFGAPLTPMQVVERIVADVRRDGDKAIADYALRLDGMNLPPSRYYVSEAEFEAAYEQTESDVLTAIRKARDNIRLAHEAQMRSDWTRSMPSGAIVGQRYIPMERIAVLVPGGRFPLVSTALMGAIPARVAGVGEVVIATPGGPEGRVDPHILVAAKEAGAHKVLRIGGAHAVAALAYGTESIRTVDKIVGPGNIFTQLAKKHVFGRVGIDSIAGPSEILVLADGTAPAPYVAADLLSQAEHDPEAAAWLVTWDNALAEAVANEVRRQLERLPDPAVARASIDGRGLIVVTKDADEAILLANTVAPEHLELIVAEPLPVLGRLRHAGAVFVGPYTPEVIGDYVAGSNHVLPTNGTARFASQLSVDDFVRRSGLIAYSEAALTAEGRDAARLAEVEGLPAHARAVRIRTEGNG